MKVRMMLGGIVAGAMMLGMIASVQAETAEPPIALGGHQVDYFVDSNGSGVFGDGDNATFSHTVSASGIYWGTAPNGAVLPGAWGDFSVSGGPAAVVYSNLDETGESVLLPVVGTWTGDAPSASLTPLTGKTAYLIADTSGDGVFDHRATGPDTVIGSADTNHRGEVVFPSTFGHNLSSIGVVVIHDSFSGDLFGQLWGLEIQN